MEVDVTVLGCARVEKVTFSTGGVISKLRTGKLVGGASVERGVFDRGHPERLLQVVEGRDYYPILG